MDKAACRNALSENGNKDVFFDPEPTVRRAACTRYCSVCPVTFECLTYSLRASPDYGIFGGMEPGERWEFARRHRGKTKENVRRLFLATMQDQLNRTERRTNADRSVGLRPKR